MFGLKRALGKMDSRPQTARPVFQQETMSSFIIILFEDLNRKQPVIYTIIYGNANTAHDLPVLLKLVYGEFKECLFLTETMRQRADEQLAFKNALQNIVLGSMSPNTAY